MIFPFRSLQARLTIAFVAIVAATVVMLGLSLTFLFDRVLQNQYASAYRSNATAACAILQSSVQGGLLPLHLGRDVAELSQAFHVRVRVYANPFNVLVADSEQQAPLSGQVGKGSRLARDGFGPVSCPLMADQTLQLGTVVVSDPLTDRAYVRQSVIQTVLWILAGASLLSFVVVGLLAERLTVPLRVLRRAAERMGAGQLSERVPAGGRDEAGELARQFNRMAEQLEESFQQMSDDRDRLRQFVADVSHEVRTPLTALRTFNDLLQNGAGQDPATRRDFLAECARQIERLEWLTHNLLDLSRLDAGITRMALQDADLAETVRRVLETNRPAAQARDVTLVLAAEPLVVPHDRPHLEQAISNIVGNAVKFSPTGGTVRIHVFARGTDGVVEVSDQGPGIPPDEQEHIFERFFRGRSANRAGEGSGLGLAIARAIVDAHHGTIAVDSAPGRGTTVHIAIPARSVAPRGTPEPEGARPGAGASHF